MGAKVSKHSNRREAKASTSVVGGSCQGSSIIEAVKPGCLKKRKTKKQQMKRVLQSPEKRITKVRKLSTLEDWLLASLSRDGLQPDCLNGGELYVFKHLSTRVRPSSREYEEAIPSTPGDMSFSVDLSSGDASCSSFSRSQSGKPRKKVSFRLPEEADILIFYSPAEKFGSDQESF
ncbi:hypothetical protein DITRI_Ditri02bG0004800 [Diplodiscus trichospermus]